MVLLWPAVVPDGGINALSGLRALQQAFLRPPGPCKRSAAGRYTSDAVPAVVPDGGINALSGLRVLHRFKQRRSAQAQRRQAAGDRTEFDEESGCRKAKTRLLGGFFK